MLDLLGDRVRLRQREVGGELEVERELRSRGERDGGDVVHLAHARHAERGRVRALAHGADRLLRLDVDDDVRLRQRVLHGALDGVGGGVALAQRRVGGDADHDVGEVAARGLAHPQPPQLDRRIDRHDRQARRLLGVGRARDP